MNDRELTPADLRQIEQEGLTLSQVRKQLEKFRQGTTPVKLLKPCTPGDGIECPAEGAKNELINRYEASSRALDIVKFVPASGAATRMFKDWFGLLEQGTSAQEEAAGHFAETILRYPFIGELRDVLGKRNTSLDECLKEGRIGDILAAVLLDPGLNYGHLPKALIKFHRYPDGCRTSLEEHFVEAAGYARSSNDLCRLHFTVSEEHLGRVRDRIRQVIPLYEAKYGVHYRVDLSVQKSSTNTIAVDPADRPFRDDRGRLVFRPAGHGALLFNLNDLAADIVFVKNIDNVSHDRLQDRSNPFKKLLAGRLLMVQERIFSYLRMISAEKTSSKTMEEIGGYCRRDLQIQLPEDFASFSDRAKGAILFDVMNRPIRICGMVKNTGEPGGGPFWVMDENGGISRQIIEQFQIDGGDPEQLKIWSSSTHFNPVDLVCGIKDYRGNQFDLSRYADQKAVCISAKSEKGRSLKALELPGLWNGSMAGWITLFIEVPLETFNPVKTIEDLLRKEHLPA